MSRSTNYSTPDPNVREALEEILLESQTTSRRAMRSAFVSLILTAIAVIAAVLSLYYARNDSIDDTAWRKQQIEYLSEIKNNTSVIHKKMPEKVKELNADKKQ
jgi:hypothetical protein